MNMNPNVYFEEFKIETGIKMHFQLILKINLYSDCVFQQSINKNVLNIHAHHLTRVLKL